MSLNEKQQALREATARKRRELEAAQLRPGQPWPGPRPGEVYLLRESADWPLSWLVVEEKPDRRQVRVVPIDTLPLRGGGDLELPAEHPLAPGWLRCRHSAWVAPRLFEPTLLRGTVPEALLGAVRLRCDTAEAPSPSPLDQEAELDEEYRDWQAETLEPAVARLVAGGERAPVATPPPPPPRGVAERRFWLPLAAALALATVGLSVWTAKQSRELADLETPQLDVPHQGVELGEESRGPEEVALPEGSRQIRLVLHLPELLQPAERYFLEIEPEGRSGSWRSPPLPARELVDGEIELTLPAARYPPGKYRLKLIAESGGRESLLASRRVELSRTAAPSP
ncbi:MAG: hypothetical protein U0002_20080 [Thermoanaerobaculia bacterium]